MLLTQAGGSWDFYSIWRFAVIVMCWVLVVFGVAFYLIMDFNDDDTPAAKAEAPQ